MFERFTASSRRTMVLTQKIANDRRDPCISGTHIALGLIENDRQTGGAMFAKLGLDLPELEAALHAEADREKQAEVESELSGSPKFTHLAKKALEMSLREALRLRHRWIGPGHMLLGILGSAGSSALVERVPLDAARAAIAEWEAERPAVEQTAGVEGEGGAVSRGFGEVMKRAMAAPKPIGSQHLLLAMFEVENSVAGKVLATLGIAKGKVASLIQAIGTAGTLDAPPQPEYEVRVGDHAIRVDHPESRDMLREILDRDPDLAERIRIAIERRAAEAGN